MSAEFPGEPAEDGNEPEEQTTSGPGRLWVHRDRVAGATAAGVPPRGELPEPDTALPGCRAEQELLGHAGYGAHLQGPPSLALNCHGGHSVAGSQAPVRTLLRRNAKAARKLAGFPF